MCEDGRILHLADGQVIRLEDEPAVSEASPVEGVRIPETNVFVSADYKERYVLPNLERRIED